MAIDQTKRNTRLANVLYYAFVAVVVVACVLASWLLSQWSFQRFDMLNTQTGVQLELPARITILARLPDADYFSKSGARVPSGAVYLAGLGKGTAPLIFPPDAPNFTDGVELRVKFFRIPFRNGKFVTEWQLITKPADGEPSIPVGSISRRTIEARGISYTVPWEKTSRHEETPSSFTYKGETVAVFEAGGELTVDGKRYGSVRAGDTVDLLTRGTVLINGVALNSQ